MISKKLPNWGSVGSVGILMGLTLSACTHVPSDSPLPDRVLAEKALRAQLIERGAADSEFVHEILHQLGQGPGGDEQLARLLAEHLDHHPSTAMALFQELGHHPTFHDWVIERLKGGPASP